MVREESSLIADLLLKIESCLELQGSRDAGMLPIVPAEAPSYFLVAKLPRKAFSFRLYLVSRLNRFGGSPSVH